MITYVFSTLFVAATLAFLAIEGAVLIWQGRRIKRLEENRWDVRGRYGLRNK